MKWVKDAKRGIVVAGGRGPGQDLPQLSHPNGVLIDAEGTIDVSDWGNDRVMRWYPEMIHGAVVAGGNERGEGANQFSLPIGLSFDRHGNLYVADYRNHRVQRFSIDI